MIDSVLNDRYRLGEELGRGGMGTVYRAHDTVLDRDVAVKLLSQSGLGTEGRARLLNEARAAAQLNHPNIVSIYDAGQAGKVPYIVMELVKARLHEQPPKDFLGTWRSPGDLRCSDHAHRNGMSTAPTENGSSLLTVRKLGFYLARRKPADDV
jgi:hypothetical protein